MAVMDAMVAMDPVVPRGAMEKLGGRVILVTLVKWVTRVLKGGWDLLAKLVPKDLLDLLATLVLQELRASMEIREPRVSRETREPRVSRETREPRE
jgi:hypothetical protein